MCYNGISQRYKMITKDFDTKELIEKMKISSTVEEVIKYAISLKTLIETAIISCLTDSQKKN